jgi:2-polyprenyl-6-methoxyphenol hydroxylase-like FAD-dependent oxidoreductase
MEADIVVIGGGLAGSTVAAEMARSGARVVVLERERKFRDRVRGENMLPWGVSAARRIGVVDAFIGAGAHLVDWWKMAAMGRPDPPRNLRHSSPHGEPSLNIYHPDMQEALIARAASAGADVRRGAVVTGLDPGGGRPVVTFEEDGTSRTMTARLVVGADGRASQVRKWAGFESRRNPEVLSIAGTLLQGCTAPDDAVHLSFGPGFASLIAPLGGGRARTYFVYPSIAGRRGLSGPEKLGEFLDLCRSTLVDPSWLSEVESAGPLAEFEGADRWVDSPARSGVVLIGDAAAATDPSWGCGLSLTLVDVEHLLDALRSTDDWDQALARYAREHDEYYGALQRILSWMTELVWSPGPEADERRGRVFARMAQDPTPYPDTVGQGPFGPNDEKARRLVLGLD